MNNERDLNFDKENEAKNRVQEMLEGVKQHIVEMQQGIIERKKILNISTSKVSEDDYYLNTLKIIKEENKSPSDIKEVVNDYLITQQKNKIDRIYQNTAEVFSIGFEDMELNYPVVKDFADESLYSELMQLNENFKPNENFHDAQELPLTQSDTSIIKKSRTIAQHTMEQVEVAGINQNFQHNNSLQQAASSRFLQLQDGKSETIAQHTMEQVEVAGINQNFQHDNSLQQTTSSRLLQPQDGKKDVEVEVTYEFDKDGKFLSSSNFCLRMFSIFSKLNKKLGDSFASNAAYEIDSNLMEQLSSGH